MSNIPEILAPAGGMPQLEAAVRSGADAVYLGARTMNARGSAANFDDRELAEAADWSYGYVSALLHGKRIRPGSREVLEGAYEKVLEERKKKKHLRGRGGGAKEN